MRTHILAIAALLPQCQFDPDQSGELCIYTARSEDQIRRELPHFVATHPEIRLRCPTIKESDAIICEEGADALCDRDNSPWEVLRQSTGTLTDTLAAQSKGDTPADVLWGVAVSHVRYLYNLDPGMFRRYTPQHTFRVQSYLEKNGGLAQNSFWSWFLDATYTDGSVDQPLWVGVDAFTVAFCVNTRKLAEAMMNTEVDPLPPLLPESLTWASLLDPRLTGKIAAPQPNNSGTGFAQLAGTLRPDYRPCDGLATDCDHWADLAALDKQVAIYTKSGDLPCELAAQKHSPIIVGITHDAADFLQDRDDQTQAYYDDSTRMRRVLPEGAGFDVAVSTLVEHPHVKPAAQTFLDWASSPEAMALYSGSTPLTAYNPAAVDIPKDLLARLQGLALDFRETAKVMDALKTSWSCQFCPERPMGDDLSPELWDALVELEENDLESLELETIGRCVSYGCDRSIL